MERSDTNQSPHLVCAIDLGITNFAVAWFDPARLTLVSTLVSLGRKIAPHDLPAKLRTKVVNEPRYSHLFDSSRVILVERPLSASRFNTVVSRDLWILYTALLNQPATHGVSSGVDSRNFVPGLFKLNGMTRDAKKKRTVLLAKCIAEVIGKPAGQTANLLEILPKKDDVADAVLIAVAFAVMEGDEGVAEVVEKATALAEFKTRPSFKP